MSTESPSNFPREKPENMAKGLTMIQGFQNYYYWSPTSLHVQSLSSAITMTVLRMTQAQYNGKGEGGDQAPILQMGV